MKEVLKILFSDINGMYACRLVFGSIGFLACIVGLFIPNVDVSKLAILVPTCAAMLAVSVFQKAESKGKEEENENK